MNKEELLNTLEQWKELAPDGYDILYLEKLTLETVEKGKVVFSMIVPKSFCNILSTLHGGAIGSLVDIVSSTAIIATNPDLPPSVSVEISTHYASSAKLGEKIKLEAIVYKMGKNLAFTETTIFNPKGDVVAKASHTKYVGFKSKL